MDRDPLSEMSDEEIEVHIGEVAYRILDGVFGTASERRRYAERIAWEARARLRPEAPR